MIFQRRSEGELEGAAQTSGLSEEITGPTDSALISLTWKGDPHGKLYTEVSGPDVEDPFEMRKREEAKKLSKESN